MLREYDQVTSFTRHGSYDPAWVLTAAAELLDEDPSALDRLHERIRLVVVDEAQELTSAAARLLRVVARPGGPRVVLIGDPDVAVQTFRGADPRFLADAWTDLAGAGRDPRFVGGLFDLLDDRDEGETVVLDRTHRFGAAMAGVADRVSRRIGALGGGEQRRMTPATDDPARGTVEVALLRSAAQETAHVAALLRRAHLVEGVPWTDMAVVVRGSGRADTMRRLLGQAGVPVEAGSAEAPVRDESAVRPLLHLLEESIEIARAEHRGESRTIDPVRAADLVLSPVGGSDTVGLRRLRRLLRQDELAAGGGRSSDELLAELLRRRRVPGRSGRPRDPPNASRRRWPRVPLPRGWTTTAAGRPGSRPSPCSGRSGRRAGVGRRLAPAGALRRRRRARAPTVTWTRCSRSSTPRRASWTGCPPRARGVPRAHPAARTCPATRLLARRTVGRVASRC